ncbi:MAG: Threonine dehydrogenase and related Zn-dependent dehydrogenases, partial [uncultured Solirubrobacteraceae bacterium]
EGPDLARAPRRPGGGGPRPVHPGADGRHHPRDVHGPVRLGPPPLRGARAVPRRGRHPRPRAHGHRRGGRLRRDPDRPRRPRGHPVQHLLRALLHVRPGAHDPVRDDAEPRARDGRVALRLHEALRAGPGRPGGVPAGAPGPLRADQGPRGPAGRPLPLPLRRPAHRLAGRGVREHPAGRERRGPRPRAHRRDVLPDRAAPGGERRPRPRPRPRAPRALPAARRADRGHQRGGRPRGGGAGAHGRARARRGHRRGRDGGPRVARRQDGPHPGGLHARRRGPQGHGDGRGGPHGGDQLRPGDGPPRRHRLALGGLRRRGEPDEPPADVRQAAQPADGPGERQALDGRPAAARVRRRRPARGRHVRHASPAPRRGPGGLRDVPEEGGRRLQGRLPPL